MQYYIQRNRKIVDLADEGMTVAEIASRFGLTPRRINAILQECARESTQAVMVDARARIARIETAAKVAGKMDENTIPTLRMIARLAGEIADEMEKR